MLNKRLFKIVPIFLLFFVFNFPLKIKSDNLKFNEQFQKITANYRYILGPGDQIKVDVLNINNMSYDLKILPDGTIILPRVGSIYLSGLNIKEATDILKNNYQKILYNPIVYLNIVKPRAIRVNVIGQVQRPGIYSLTQSEISILSNSDGGEQNKVNFNGWPTVIDAIQKSGGVTTNGNLKSVALKRKLKKNSPRIELKLNFWDSLVKGQEFINPLIYDGDIIEILKSNKFDPEEKLKVSKSNFAPATISVIVIGQVVNPGKQLIRSSSPLSEAIFSAGGLTKKAKKTDINLYRLEDNGKTQLRKLRFNPSLMLSNSDNPTLNDRDVIFVGKNAWAKFNSSLDTLVDPVAPILNAATIFKLFEN